MSYGTKNISKILTSKITIKRIRNKVNKKTTFNLILETI